MSEPALLRAILAGSAASAVLLAGSVPGQVDVDPGSPQGRTAAAIAEFRAAVGLEPDLARGARLFDTCSACHGQDARGADDGSVPAIAGQHVSVLVKQLVDFRYDRRWDERMRNFASQHHLAGPQELLDVAAYAGSLPRWPPQQAGDCGAQELEQGRVIYHRDCADCHGPLGMGELRRMRPRIAGQHYRYLLRQMQETAAERRPGMDPRHVSLLGALTAEERSAVANYLSRLCPHLASIEEGAP